MGWVYRGAWEGGIGVGEGGIGVGEGGLEQDTTS